MLSAQSERKSDPTNETATLFLYNPIKSATLSYLHVSDHSIGPTLSIIITVTKGYYSGLSGIVGFKTYCFALIAERGFCLFCICNHYLLFKSGENCLLSHSASCTPPRSFQISQSVC